jgi:hypothetical protein
MIGTWGKKTFVLVAEGGGIKVSPDTTVEDRLTDDVARQPVRTSRRIPRI